MSETNETHVFVLLINKRARLKGADRLKPVVRRDLCRQLISTSHTQDDAGYVIVIIVLFE